MDNGIRIAREMMDVQAELAMKAHAAGRETDASAHWYAHRALMAISATSGTVTDADAIRWMSVERDNERRCCDDAEKTECGYAAGQLEMLAIAIRAR